MPIMVLLVVGTMGSMALSMWGAVKLGHGPSTKWSALMWGGLAATYATSGMLSWAFRTWYGQNYLVLLLIPIAMSYAAYRTYRQTYRSS